METGQVLYNDREAGPFREGSCHGQEALGRLAGKARVQGTPPRLVNAPWQEVTATAPVGERSLNTPAEACLALCVSAHVGRGGSLVLGIQSLSHIYGLHLQGDFQFNEYPRKYLMSNTSSCP